VFVAIYRWRLQPGREDDFRRAWIGLTEIIRVRCGSGGSSLFRDADETFVGIARWPSRAAWERCFANGPLDPEMSALMRASVLEQLPTSELEGVADLWTAFPSG
jgi:heme-degrading monooxygenase HmoA